MLYLDGGDMFGHRNKNEQHQTRFLCEATADFGLDAIGLGERDLNFGVEFLHEMMQTHHLPFTNANVRDAAGELVVPEFLVVERGGVTFGIVSVLDPSHRIITMNAGGDKFEVADPIETLREVIPRLREQVDTIVLLGHLGEAPTETVLKEVKGIDLAVIGHTFRNLTSERVVAEVPLLASAYEGRYIGRADIFIDGGDGQVMAIDVKSTSLDEEVADDQEMLARVRDYQKSLEEFKLAKRAAYPRSYGSERENFLGDRSCKGCHEEAWESYAASGHKQAFATIRRQGQAYEPECLSCHTTGFQHKNGYADEPPFNRLINVQCEACHGYGTEHARDGRWAAQARNSCTTCHDQENSPEFDYASYWEKIKH